ncbi:glyceraldehyde-3-phosphate dehydrogenase [Rubrobacter xylanophilus DSM 9941]|uniref:Glyceraldehyde-3-phosphate dehydrogenase n=1 Tax=Rubrobacter xylanophilus (strain DSM 9941 / JCM 11954 / NBRC 16129 / PRD-1) TaxID=266117 RepID=Q1AUH6_RUBXD|nr:type I glyceraldehyde-3-phosphate dehydrogenase [Rubrobacter xylanophilus]ABG04952.1 glyceraldehyde-3-phosphate dehydrogenase [Rubrobacter xylanophilus DSM 9941]
MAVRIGINGFGRIGMLVAKAAMQRGDVEVVAVNDLMPMESLALLFKRDSTHGIWDEDVALEGSVLRVGDRQIKTFSEREPSGIPWGDVGADIVVEATGKFTSRDGAAGHLEGGAKKVVISAPAKGADATFVYKVNHETYDPDNHQVVSNASCTTNCIIPMVKVLQDNFGIESGFMTTCHAYTNDQSLLDAAHKDPRRARSAPNNIVPTSTGAARTAGVIYPELRGKVDGMALRVPVPDGSITDFVAELSREASVEEVNGAFRRAAEGELSGILEYSEAPIVSQDIVGNPASCIFDAPLTMSTGRTVKVLGWYDNEWGYSNRTVDLVSYIGERL